MSKKVTKAQLMEGLVNLTQAVSNMSRDNQREFARINRRLDEHDLQFTLVNRRLTNLEEDVAEIKADVAVLKVDVAELKVMLSS